MYFKFDFFANKNWKWANKTSTVNHHTCYTQSSKFANFPLTEVDIDIDVDVDVEITTHFLKKS